MWYYLTHCQRDKGVRTFPEGISPKVNAIARVKFELSYYNVTVEHVSHYSKGTPHISDEQENISKYLGSLSCKLIWALLKLDKTGAQKYGPQNDKTDDERTKVYTQEMKSRKHML